jgi:hypothetical protein
MQKQRRDRRKPREVSDHAMLTLHKYYLRTDHMRRDFMKAADELIALHGEQALTNYHNSIEYFRTWMFRDYWVCCALRHNGGLRKIGADEC